jgi:hypothetical protein
MYLARQIVKGKVHFFIRESFREGDLVRSRDLFHLGPDPSRFIIYPGGNAFYIDDTVTNALLDLDVDVSSDELDDVFWPFLNSRLQRILEPLRYKATFGGLGKKRMENKEGRTPIHCFDERRICYLKCGHISSRIMSRLPQTIFQCLIDKSRDEIEQRFLDHESYLNARELKTYIYAIFDLQRFFPESFARQHPQWLDQEKVEKYLTDEICLLHQDRSFWAGEVMGKRLHEYLRRYVIMFFDNDYEQRNPLNDYLQDFINRHRARPNVLGKNAVNMEKASVIFGVKKQTLETMTKQGLTRFYRRLAKKFHPDKGGSQEKFVELTEFYHALLRKRS